jgi:DNA end-binding protein Ku
VPDGEVGAQAFAVIREAIREEGMVALGRVVFTSREHVIALEAREKGLLGMTLRYPYEVRKQSDYFDDIPDEKIPKDMLELASHIVKSKAGHFHPEKFEDQYEDALKELLRKKQAGQKIEAPKAPTDAKVINLNGRAAPERGDGGRRRTEARAARGCAAQVTQEDRAVELAEEGGLVAPVSVTTRLSPAFHSGRTNFNARSRRRVGSRSPSFASRMMILATLVVSGSSGLVRFNARNVSSKA